MLKEWKQEVETGLGKVRRVRGQTDWISGENAEATGVLVADERERRLRFSLAVGRARAAPPAPPRRGPRGPPRR